MIAPRYSFPILAAAFFLLGVGCKPASETINSSAESASPATTETKTAKAKGKITDLDADAAADLVDENSEIVVIDVRTPEEFASGHIQGALNIDFKGAGFQDEVAKLDSAKTYLLHCRSGARSTSSLPVFEQLGFSEIYHLKGGFNSWREAGNPYVTD